MLNIRIVFINLFLIFLFSPLPTEAQYAPGNLFAAARAGNLNRVKELIAQNSDQNLLDEALGAAVVGDQIEIMRFLIEQGANVNHVSSWNNHILINAIMYDHFEAATILIEAGADVNISGYRREKHGIQIEWHWTPLMCAARKGALDLIQLLIDHGARVNEQGWSQSSDDPETAADIAAYSGHLKALKILMKEGVSVDNETLYKCARGGHLDTLKYLISKKKWDIDKLSPFSGKTLLMEASWWGHIDIVRYLLKKRAAVNKQGRYGYTALSEAVSNPDKDLPHQTEIVKLLIKEGADVQLASQYYPSPLRRAQKAGNPEIIKLLLEHDAK